MAAQTFVRDIAIQLVDYPHIDSEKTVSDAVDVLRAFTCGDLSHLKFSELMVMNKKQAVIGRLRLHDILEGLEPRLFEDKPQKFEGPEEGRADLTILWEDVFEKDCRKRAGRPVKEFMTTIGSMVQANDHLLKALYIMVRGRESSVPVAEAGNVIGVIRMEEVFNTISVICNL